MQGEATVFSGFSKQLLRSAIVLLLSLAAFEAYAQEGVLGFRGQVLNPTCAVDTELAARLIEQARLGQLRAGLEVKVSRITHTCQAQALPLSTHFQPLVDPDSRRVSESAGVLTVTYQ